MKRVSTPADRPVVKGLVMAVILGTLFACAVYNVHPSRSQNYTLTMLSPLTPSFEDMWRDKMAEASRVQEDQQALLESSDEIAVQRWRQGLDALQGKPPLQQLDGVNRLVNRSVNYLADYEHWKRLDRWGYPYETLTEGGDCEDFALLKAESLRRLGWAPERLQLLIGYSTITRPPGQHAVLLATLDDGAQVILDNAEHDLVLPSEDRHFHPMYAVTRDQLYQASPGSGSLAPPLPYELGKRIARRQLAQ